MRCVLFHPCPSVLLQACLLYLSIYALFLWIFGSTSGVWRYSMHWQALQGILAGVIVPLLLLFVFMIW